MQKTIMLALVKNSMCIWFFCWMSHALCQSPKLGISAHISMCVAGAAGAGGGVVTILDNGHEDNYPGGLLWSLAALHSDTSATVIDP